MGRCIWVLILLSTASYSGTATQTDWSGGSGVPGPVIDWGTSYDTSTDVDDTGGTLKLNLSIFNPTEHIVSGTLHDILSVHASDIDGDGDLDVLACGWGTDTVIWWENTDGTGTTWSENPIDAAFENPTSVYTSDVNGDGDMDVVGSSDLNGIVWWENINGTGTSWTKHTVDEIFWGAWEVYASDVNGDGDIDVLGAAAYGNDITWWENVDGTGTSWIEHTVDGDFNNARSVYASDVNGDGDIDVLGAACYDNDITWWENTDGTGTAWTEHNIDGNFIGAYSVYACNMDGDTDMDVLGAAIDGNELTWWENTDGIGTAWTEHTVDGAYDGACSVYASDVDGDGDNDILGAASGADEITCWENTDGTGTAWTEHTVDGAFDGAWSVYASDIDGDGDNDVLGGARINGNDVIWWDLIGYKSGGVLESSILNVEGIDSWDFFFSNSQQPVNTTVGFQFRSSTDFANMGAWSDTVYSNIPLSGILADETQYLQYKVILTTSDHSSSPILEDVFFGYTTFVGIEENNSGEITSWGLTSTQNPSYEYYSALISVPETGMVQLSLYDVSGRVIAEYSQEFPSGTHSVTFQGLSQGVYFCVMNAEEYTAIERVVILK